MDNQSSLRSIENNVRGNDLQCYMHSVAVLKITRIPGRQFYLNPASEAHS